MQTLHAPVVAFIFALWLIGYVVLDLDRLTGPGHGRGGSSPGRRARPCRARWGHGAAAGSVSLAAASAGTDGSVATVRPGHRLRPATRRGRRRGHRAPDRPRSPFLLGPKVAAACRIAMGVTMAFMLIIMI